MLIVEIYGDLIWEWTGIDLQEWPLINRDSAKIPRCYAPLAILMFKLSISESDGRSATSIEFARPERIYMSYSRKHFYSFDYCQNSTVEITDELSDSMLSRTSRLSI